MIWNRISRGLGGRAILQRCAWMSDGTKEKVNERVSPKEARELAMFVVLAVLPVLGATYVFIVDPDMPKKSFVIAEEGTHQASTEAQYRDNHNNFANIKGLKSVKKT